MHLELPRPLRVALYLIVMFSAPFVAYFSAIGAIGEAEMALWAGLSGVASLVAGLNLTPQQDK